MTVPTTPSDGGNEPAGGGNEPSGEDAQAEQLLADATHTFGQDDVDRIVSDRLARERRGIDELRQKASKYDELEEAQKTEQQKLTEQMETLRSEGTRSARELQQLQVALDEAPEGMSLARVRKLAGRLTGDDDDALRADARELFAEMAPADSPSGGGRRPKESLGTVPIDTGGGKSGSLTDMNDWMRAQRSS